MIFEKYLSDKILISAKKAWFDTIIARYEDIYNSHPFTQQSGQSLTELYLLVKSFCPKTIIELGCGSRSSTFALSVAAQEIGGCDLYGIDIGPVDFVSLMRKNFPHISYKIPKDFKAEASTFSIDGFLNPPVFLFYDAHDGDLPGINISSHAVRDWFPKLKGQLIAFHDITPFKEPPSVPPGYCSRHFLGTYLKGYAEVVPITEWMNKNQLPFYRPTDELVQLGVIAGGSSLIYVRP